MSCKVDANCVLDMPQVVSSTFQDSSRNLQLKFVQTLSWKLVEKFLEFGCNLYQSLSSIREEVARGSRRGSVPCVHWERFVNWSFSLIGTSRFWVADQLQICKIWIFHREIDALNLSTFDPLFPWWLNYIMLILIWNFINFRYFNFSTFLPRFIINIFSFHFILMSEPLII